MSKQLFTSLLLLASLAVPGFCKSAGAGPRSMVLSGDEAGGNVQEVLRRVKWHTNLNSALGEAQRKNKMVLWIHMIGKVDGAT